MLLPDCVAIESQTIACKKMHAIAHAIQTYFVCRRRGAEVRFVCPRNKLTVYRGPGSAAAEAPPGSDAAAAVPFDGWNTPYQRNKSLSVEHCSRMVSGPALTFFSALRKKDDAADAFLQGAHVLSMILGDRPKKKRAARKKTKAAAAAPAKRARRTDAASEGGTGKTDAGRGGGGGARGGLATCNIPGGKLTLKVLKRKETLTKDALRDRLLEWFQGDEAESERLFEFLHEGLAVKERRVLRRVMMMGTEDDDGGPGSGQQQQQRRRRRRREEGEEEAGVYDEADVTSGLG
eukprot:tig00000681_g3084.t1